MQRESAKGGKCLKTISGNDAVFFFFFFYDVVPIRLVEWYIRTMAPRRRVVLLMKWIAEPPRAVDVTRFTAHRAGASLQL